MSHELPIVHIIVWQALSACDTGVGPVGTSGVESVVTAFIQAGASSVVATLWELEDHSSNRFMKA